MEGTLDWRDPSLLKRFVEWYLGHLDKGFLPVATVFDNVTHVSDSSGVVLFRKGPLQVQLFLNRPATEIPDHVHPNIDSYEAYFGGPMYFRKAGKLTTSPENTFPLLTGKSSAWGLMTEVPANCWHGGTVGTHAGAAFLSLQLWKNDVAPTSVERDWDGSRYGNDHLITTGPMAALPLNAKSQAAQSQE